MASITKPFVATAIMQLAELGRVDLDAPITKYVPYFHLKDPRYPSITVRLMLTHTSGMPDVEDYRWDKPELRRRRVLSAMSAASKTRSCSGTRGRSLPTAIWRTKCSATWWRRCQR